MDIAGVGADACALKTHVQLKPASHTDSQLPVYPWTTWVWTVWVNWKKLMQSRSMQFKPALFKGQQYFLQFIPRCKLPKWGPAELPGFWNTLASRNQHMGAAEGGGPQAQCCHRPSQGLYTQNWYKSEGKTRSPGCTQWLATTLRTHFSVWLRLDFHNVVKIHRLKTNLLIGHFTGYRHTGLFFEVLDFKWHQRQIFLWEAFLDSSH